MCLRLHSVPKSNSRKRQYASALPGQLRCSFCRCSMQGYRWLSRSYDAEAAALGAAAPTDVFTPSEVGQVYGGRNYRQRILEAQVRAQRPDKRSGRPKERGGRPYPHEYTYTTICTHNSQTFDGFGNETCKQAGLASAMPCLWNFHLPTCVLPPPSEPTETAPPPQLRDKDQEVAFLRKQLDSALRTSQIKDDSMAAAEVLISQLRERQEAEKTARSKAQLALADRVGARGLPNTLCGRCMRRAHALPVRQ